MIGHPMQVMGIQMAWVDISEAGKIALHESRRGHLLLHSVRYFDGTRRF